MWLGQQTGDSTWVALILLCPNTGSTKTIFSEAKRTHTRASTRAHTHTKTSMHTHIPADSHKLLCRHSITPSFINSYMHSHTACRKQPCIYTGSDIMSWVRYNGNMQTHTHTHTHTHTTQRSSLEASKQMKRENIKC